MGSTYTYAVHGCPIEVEDDSNILIAYPDGPGTRKKLRYQFGTHEQAEDALMLLATGKATLTDYEDKKLTK